MACIQEYTNMHIENVHCSREVSNPVANHSLKLHTKSQVPISSHLRRPMRDSSRSSMMNHVRKIKIPVSLFSQYRCIASAQIIHPPAQQFNLRPAMQKLQDLPMFDTCETLNKKTLALMNFVDLDSAESVITIIHYGIRLTSVSDWLCRCDHWPS